MIKFLLKRLAAHYFFSVKNLIGINVLKENRKLKDMHKGGSCFILGSGSSINEMDLSKLKNKIVITQNNFHVHKDIKDIKPNYHCVVPKYQPIEYDKDWLLWIDTMKDRMPHDTIFCWGTNTRYLIDKIPDIRERSFFVKVGLKPLYMKKASIDICKYIMNIPTALTMCLTLALYMGFDKIYLVGMDLDQICKQKEKEVGRFYGESIITQNKAEKEIHSKLIDDGKLYFSRWVTLIQLKLMREYAETNGIEIVNLTKGGMLYTFKRDDYLNIV